MSKDSDRHLLIIEAKKGKSSQHDINKIISLMTDDRYLYNFGLTVSYSSNENYINGKLYYKGTANNILSEDLIIKRKNFRN